MTTTTSPPTTFEGVVARTVRGALPSVVATLAAVVLALIVGALLIVFTDSDSLHALGRGDIGQVLSHVGSSYKALVVGAVGGGSQIATTLEYAAPLICAGLGVTLAFRAGLFNIGAQGQLIVGAVLCAYVGFHWHLPAGIHVIVAVLAAMIGGAVWGGISGVLKARTGAHEVITTMMLNYVAKFGVLYYLLTKTAFQRPGQSNPTSPLVDHNALFPQVFGFHSGVILTFVLAAGVWWLLERSTWGFEMRAVGANPEASRTAGMSITRVTTVVMTLAGLLAGLGAAMQILGQNNDLTQGTGGSIGFDAITVALLGRATPLGTVLAGILWGGLQVGSANMQAAAGTPAELTEVVQALIVMFVAAPALVRSIVRLKIINREQTLAAKGWGG